MPGQVRLLIRLGVSKPTDALLTTSLLGSSFSVADKAVNPSARSYRPDHLMFTPLCKTHVHAPIRNIILKIFKMCFQNMPPKLTLQVLSQIIGLPVVFSNLHCAWQCWVNICWMSFALLSGMSFALTWSSLTISGLLQLNHILNHQMLQWCQILAAGLVQSGQQRLTSHSLQIWA